MKLKQEVLSKCMKLHSWSVCKKNPKQNMVSEIVMSEENRSSQHKATVTKKIKCESFFIPWGNKRYCASSVLLSPLGVS